jgi:uncharacterized protein YlzI (FlbEa/FlbD family)
MTAGEVVTVNGVKRTQKACYMEALRINPDHAIGWYILGASMAAGEVVTVNGVKRTQNACYVEALRINPDLYQGAS